MSRNKKQKSKQQGSTAEFVQRLAHQQGKRNGLRRRLGFSGQKK